LYLERRQLLVSSELNLDTLAEASKQLIVWNQHASGGYVASPLFSHYTFSWLRDGSFIAYSMDCAGEYSSSDSFYHWVNRIISRKIDYIQHLIAKQQRGEYIAQHEFLHTRYHLDGRDDEHSEWGHFQLDGYGAWLWGVTEHWKASGVSTIPESFIGSIQATVDYLLAFWRYPNFDCWEEYCDHVHPSTLACIYGGLSSIAEFDQRPELLQVCEDIRAFLLEHAVHPDGHFVKYISPVYEENGSVDYSIGNSGVDANLMWLCLPFGVFAIDHPVMQKTFAKITIDLRTPHGGIRRYETDSYYGGGEWLLLTAWYGLLQLASGNRLEAEEALQWIAKQSDALGRLPEQVPDALEDRSTYEDWVQRWGMPAHPLLWSHAMYLVLYYKLQQNSV
jgi:GH15 family glucan-1,4-alpha-glucosidase